jgi:hypothetical protein
MDRRARMIGLCHVVVAAIGCDGHPDGVELPTSERQDLVAVGLLGERCSVAAIDVGGGPDAPAYALTAGHCTGLSAIVNAHAINHAVFSLGTIRFGLFVDTEDRPIEVATVERPYATILGADLAIYRLDATIGELRARGVAPIPLADAPPPAGDPIAIAGFPQETEDDPRRVLHLSRCDRGDAVRLAEANLVFIDFFHSDCRSIRPGSSGGPLLDEDGRIFGVTSTAANRPDSSHPLCELNYPCEVDGDRPRWRSGAVYGAPIRTLPACFTDGVFDLDAAGCALTRPDVPAIGGERYATDGAWRVALVDAGLPYYRTKAGLATEVRCEVDVGYGPPIAIADRPTITDPFASGPAGEPYVLCIHGLEGPTPAPFTRFLDRTTMLQVRLGGEG